MINITGIAFTGYPVTDIARARAFYEQTLGLRSSTVFEHEGKHWIEYDLGPATLAIANMSADRWKPSADGPCAALELADFPAAVTALRAAGVKFVMEPMDTGVCHFAIVADPDGNSLALHQRHKQ